MTPISYETIALEAAARRASAAHARLVPEEPRCRCKRWFRRSANDCSRCASRGCRVR